MARLAPVEKTVKYVAVVDSLTDAWAFVMESVDKVGEPPSITINPAWWLGEDANGDDSIRVYEVVVSGMTEEK